MIPSLPVRSLTHLLYNVTVSTRLCAFWLRSTPCPPDTRSNYLGASSYPSLLGVLLYFLTSTEIELSLKGTTSSAGF